jgi:hypothetical protein
VVFIVTVDGCERNEGLVTIPQQVEVRPDDVAVEEAVDCRGIHLSSGRTELSDNLMHSDVRVRDARNAGRGREPLGSGNDLLDVVHEPVRLTGSRPSHDTEMTFDVGEECAGIDFQLLRHGEAPA